MITYNISFNFVGCLPIAALNESHILAVNPSILCKNHFSSPIIYVPRSSEYFPSSILSYDLICFQKIFCNTEGTKV